MSYCLNPECPSPENPDTDFYCTACGHSLLLGDRYRALEPIGEGGFGKTYLAVDDEFPDRPRCVIKHVFPGDGSDSPAEDLERFRQEVDRLEELGEHPQIPALLDYVEDEDGNYLVQEFIDGENFEVALQEGGPFDEDGIRQLLEDLLPVLAFIHKRRVIHRDIKPQNLIAPIIDSPVVLVDFGSAKRATGTALARTGTVIGSAGYLAPEQAMGKAVFSSDLYSLGVTCVHLLTGMHPFELFSVSQDDWVWQDYLLEPISDELAYVLNRMLRRSVQQRYRTATAALKDLRSPPLELDFTRSRRLSYAIPKDIAAIAGYAPEPTLSPAPSPVAAPERGQPWYCAHQLTGHSGSVTTVAVSPSGQVLASGSTDHRIILWNLQTGTKLHTIEGRSLWNHNGHGDRVNALHFTPDGTALVSGSDDGTIKLWNLSNRTLISTLSSAEWLISAIAISPDGSLLVSGGANGAIEFWDLERGEFIERIWHHENRISDLSISPDGKALLSSSYDKTIRLWDLRTAELVNTFHSHRDRIGAMALSFDWRVMVSGGDDGDLTFWDVKQAVPMKTIQAHKDAIHSIAASPAAWLFASGGDDTCVQIWSLEDKTGNSSQVEEGYHCPLAPEGETLKEEAQGDGRSPVIPDHIHRLCILNHVWSVNSLAFSPKGHELVSGSADESIKIWQRGAGM